MANVRSEAGGSKPTALTRKVQADILKGVEAGLRLGRAALAAGVDHAAVLYWRNRLDLGDPKAARYLNFFIALKSAAAVAERRALEVVSGGESNWQARAWILERRFPERWASWKDRPASADPASRRAVIEAAAALAASRRAAGAVPGPTGSNDDDDDDVPGDGAGPEAASDGEGD